MKLRFDLDNSLIISFFRRGINSAHKLRYADSIVFSRFKSYWLGMASLFNSSILSSFTDPNREAFVIDFDKYYNRSTAVGWLNNIGLKIHHYLSDSVLARILCEVKDGMHNRFIYTLSIILFTAVLTNTLLFLLLDCKINIPGGVLRCAFFLLSISGIISAKDR